MTVFPCIDIIATGTNIKNIRMANDLSVRDLQNYFGFDQPQAIYKWQWGECLPSIDNLYALSKLFHVPIDKILVGSNEDFSILLLVSQNYLLPLGSIDSSIINICKFEYCIRG